MNYKKLVVAGALAACGAPSTGTDAGVANTYFQGSASAALGRTGNQAACATCHSTDGSLGHSGNSMKDLAYHTSFKGGDAHTLLEGANACVTGWMGGTALTATDARWLSLEAYLQSLANPSVTTPNALSPEVLADVTAYETAYSGGNATAGEAKYAASCGFCHDGALQVGPAAAISKATLKAYGVGRIAQKVRTSGPPPSSAGAATDATPGPMPFFEPKDLSSEDLKDIIAWLRR